MADDRLEQRLQTLEDLFVRWYAKESVGNEIIQALRSDDADAFGGLFAIVQAARAANPNEALRPGSNGWWTVRRVANGDARRPWYELTDDDIAALAAD